MATKQINLPNIPQGWFMTWTFATQATYNICVTLADNKTTYVNNVCRANSSFGISAEGFQQVAGSNLTLTITVASADTLQTVLIPYSVPNTSGDNVGFGYNLLLEDSTDNDFNDLFGSIVAWQSSG